jgi:hypothetical protein
VAPIKTHAFDTSVSVISVHTIDVTPAELCDVSYNITFLIIGHLLRHVQNTLIEGIAISCIRYLEKGKVKVPCTFPVEYAAFSQEVSLCE